MNKYNCYYCKKALSKKKSIVRRVPPNGFIRCYCKVCYKTIERYLNLGDILTRRVELGRYRFKMLEMNYIKKITELDEKALKVIHKG